MTEAEWLEVCVEIQARWPHSTIPDESVAVWYMDLRDLPADQVSTAVRAVYRDGREWPPNGAQIRAKALELSRPRVDHGQAWALLCEARSKWGQYAGEGGELGDAKALAWIAERSPETAEAVRRFGYRELCTYNLSDEQAVRAQFRDIYRAVSERAERDARYEGLALPGAPEGPRQIGAVVREIASGRD